jgi:hypothetical protein
MSPLSVYAILPPTPIQHILPSTIPAVLDSRLHFTLDGDPLSSARLLNRRVFEIGRVCEPPGQACGISRVFSRGRLLLLKDLGFLLLLRLGKELSSLYRWDSRHGVEVELGLG